MVAKSSVRMETASARRSMVGAGDARARPLRKRVERYETRIVVADTCCCEAENM